METPLPPPLPPSRKYVSIFRIDGEPILPPLMTTEKRRQMQKFKERALIIEQRRRELKQRHYCDDDMNNEEIKSETSRSSVCNNFSHRSQEYYEKKLKESEESILLLKNIIERQQREHCVETVDTACNTATLFHLNRNQEKLQKLQKSEILIYDNSTNEVIQVPPEKSNKNFEDHKALSIEEEHNQNVNNVPTKKPSNLLLAGTVGEGVKSIPTICLNPPTPSVFDRKMCETLRAEESNEVVIISEKANESLILEDINSDESFTSMITQSDSGPVRNGHQKSSISKATKTENAEKGINKTQTPIKNISVKIKQNEITSSDTNTPQTSPEKFYQTRKSYLGPSTSNMNRSATSSSIKLPTGNHSSSPRLKNYTQDLENPSLTRSSSFTLEGPSRSLMDHMRQQKTIDGSRSTDKSSSNSIHTTITRTVASSLRAHRDTVESKAKKVQKVELKSSKLKIQQKSSQNNFAQTAKSNANLITHKGNNLYKTKRSPYQSSKTFHTSPPTMQKTSSTQMRKSNSTPSNFMQNKTFKSRISSSTTQTSISTSTSLQTNSAKSPQKSKESFSQMDVLQKEKFQRLLAEQEEEHRKLQQSFEMQQKLLIEQFNQEMPTTQLKSCINSSCNSFSPDSSLHKRHDHYYPVSSPLKDKLNLTDLAPDNHSEKQSMSKSNFHQHNQNRSQQPYTNGNNNSHVCTTQSQSQSQISLSPHLSQGSHNQSPPAIPLANSYLLSMDHSNANTSVDISTPSTQTSVDNLFVTPTTQNSSDHNVDDNKTTSSLRRRLFTTEINTAEVGDKKPLSSSTGSSSHSPRHCLEGKEQQPSQINKSPMILTNSVSNRRLEKDSLLQHSAATKINAYARGFLVRRLFQTEQIQRVVQTIRDTLIFVLNLHLETIENPEESHTPANIKLKARLLQQLSSACRTLHLVFFQTTIKERMEIIARDRKRIKMKLLSMNRRRTPRIAG